MRLLHAWFKRARQNERAMTATAQWHVARQLALLGEKGVKSEANSGKSEFRTCENQKWFYLESPVLAPSFTEVSKSHMRTPDDPESHDAVR